MRPIVFDVSHLVTRLSRRATSGVDRVDFAYARHFLDASPRAIAATQYGLFSPHVLNIPSAQALVEHFRRAQSESEASGQAELPSGCAASCCDFVSGAGIQSRSLVAGLRIRMVQSLFRVWHDPRMRVPRNAIYLSVAQHAFEHHRFFNWLERRPDVVPVFLIHDLLPLDFPEFFPRGYEPRFHRRVETMIRHARAIIATSFKVAQRIKSEYGSRGLAPVPVHVEPLASPLEMAGDEKGRDDGGPDASYFVAISTIEPRKNYALLIAVWRELLQRRQPAPRLVVVGQRGWDSEQVFRELDLAPDLQQCVVEVSSLPSSRLRNLIRNARALLMPSFSEGYGLPIVEALSLGTPVICSDIPVFREVSQQKALLVSPVDGVGWLEAIESLAPEDSPLRNQLLAKAREFKTPTWRQYFRNIEAFLASL